MLLNVSQNIQSYQFELRETCFCQVQVDLCLQIVWKAFTASCRKQFSFLGHCFLQTNSPDANFKCHENAQIVLLEEHRYRNLLFPAVTSSGSHCVEASKCAANSKFLPLCICRLKKDAEITGILLFM